MPKSLRIVSFKVALVCAAQAGLASPVQAAAEPTRQVAQSAGPVNQLIVKLRATQAPTDASRATAARGDIEAVIDRVLAKRRERAAGRAFGAAAAASPGNPGDPAVGIRVKREMSGGATVLSLRRYAPFEQVQLLARDFERDTAIEYAEPDARMRPYLTPNDPRYAEQWSYFDPKGGANLPKAWDRTIGSARVAVAVIDTGYRPHPDLLANLAPGYDFVSDPAIANDGDGRDNDASDPGDWITVQEDADMAGTFYGCGPSDSSWHGTHVSGTVGAMANNGMGVAGVAWVGKVLPVRVLGKCGGMLSDIVDGMRWAAGVPVPDVPHNPNPAKVLNLSLGGYARRCSTTYQKAIDEINGRGAHIVVAAGNQGGSVSTAQPANCRGVIAVGATDIRGARASFSNHGAGVKISAPGVGIVSTSNDGQTSPLADSYVPDSGTSMAAPHVSGTVALMLAVNPHLLPSELEKRLLSSARPFLPGSNCTTKTCGAGLLDAGNAVDAASR